MKKVININFQGRVIPIEESAYDKLQVYIASLRTYFANEDGRDEIINDIESRIGELFAEHLKKGNACITDSDVEAIMDSMGRPADFEEADEAPSLKDQTANNQGTNNTGNQNSNNQSANPDPNTNYQKKRMYRDEEDKILGGVASGLANYLNIDPAVMRILFALTAFAGGFGFLAYIVLWIALPSRSLATNIRKRLYRDTEDCTIAGVCGGLAKYFDISVAIPRVIFAAPFIFGLITTAGHNFFFNGPIIIGSFSGSTFFLAYVILWIVLPEAKTTAEKLEMKGEKIDLNSIRNTIMEDIKGFREKAEKMGKEFGGTAGDMGEKARQMSREAGRIGREFGKAGQHFTTAAGNIAGDTSAAFRRSSSGLGNAIIILVRAFVIFIGGMIAIGLFIGLIVLLGGGLGYVPLKDFILEGTWQNACAWGTLLFFVGVPVVAFITWLIRRLMKNKKQNRFISYSFSALWVVGWFFLICLIVSLNKSFYTISNPTLEDISLVQPSNNNLFVTLSEDNSRGYTSWPDFDGAVGVDGDSLFLNTARVNIIRSADSLYHMHIIKISNGKDVTNSRSLAERIDFQIVQKDSVVYLPESFGISKTDKWRNQRVLVVIEVPVGKKINLDQSLYDYDYFTINLNNRRNRRNSVRSTWENGEYWEANKDMIMTTEDLVPVKRKKNEDGRYKYPEDEKQKEAEPKDENDTEDGEQPAATPQKDSLNKKDSGYRYHAAVQELKKVNQSTKTPETIEKATVSNEFSPLSSFLM